MNGALRISVLLMVSLATAVALIVIVGTWRWGRTTNEMVVRLSAIAESAVAMPPIDMGRLERVPPPVARYFAFALNPDQRPLRHAALRFTGHFAARPNEWSSFTAEQHVNPERPGFVWDARIAMMPVVPVLVRDSYVDEQGAMRAAAAGVVSFVNQRGTPELAAASLQRFLAEAVWFPTALLPRDGLSWSPIDDTSSRVTLTDGATTASIDVHFGSRGEIETVSAMRYRDVKGMPVLTPWIGRHGDYAPMDGMMIPTSGEVAWVLPEGATPYWRGRLVSARYERCWRGRACLTI